MTGQIKLVIIALTIFCNSQLICLQPACGQTSEEIFKQQREEMVKTAVIAAGIKDERVIEAIRSTPRHEFIPKKIRKTQSYLDAGIPIGESQTISSPFIVAYMTESLDPQPTDKVLEIGTGSGYQAAVLSPLVKEVYSIEIVAPLGERARADPQKTEVRQRQSESRRRLSRLARVRALRQNHCDVFARRHSSTAV